MAQKKKPAPRKKKKTTRRFQFQLGYGGVAGIAVVMFCLFLWMFLLGIWAGQTILLPSAGGTHETTVEKSVPSTPIKILKPRKSKTPVSREKSE
jgi:hypothetical protein